MYCEWILFPTRYGYALEGRIGRTQTAEYYATVYACGEPRYRTELYASPVEAREAAQQMVDNSYRIESLEAVQR